LEIRFGDPIDLLDPAEDAGEALARLRAAMVRLAPECVDEELVVDDKEQ
jgi:hypothetical protein